MLSRMQQKIAEVLVKPRLSKKIQRTSFYRRKGIDLEIPPGVFHPKYFFSTRYLMQYILTKPIAGAALLELGAGSGLIAIACAKAGASVTASDISRKAISALHENVRRNKADITIVQSDLFASLPDKYWQYIVINPPYYPREPHNEFETAWYCGADFAYFENLFAQLPERLGGETQAYMVLSEECNLERIAAIAQKNGITLAERQHRRFYWEINYIFELQLR